jgi:hypothetical protein
MLNGAFSIPNFLTTGVKFSEFRIFPFVLDGPSLSVTYLMFLLYLEEG